MFSDHVEMFSMVCRIFSELIFFLREISRVFLKDLICLLKESKVFFFLLKDLLEFFDDLVCFLIEP